MIGLLVVPAGSDGGADALPASVAPAPAVPLDLPPGAPAGVVAVNAVAAAAEPAASSAPSSADQVEVCGLGWVDLGADGSPDVDAIAEPPALMAARRNLVVALRQSADEFARAVGESIGGSVGGSIGGSAGGSAAPTLSAPASVPGVAAEPRERMARLARSTRDPRVYALAFRSCQSGDEAGPECAQLSAAQWARLDDGNAAPWAYVLAASTARRDAAERDEALFRISRAARFDRATYAAVGEVVAHAGDGDIGALAAYRLGREVLGRAAALPLPLAGLVEACRGRAIEDSNRRQVCDAAAEVLALRADSLQVSRVGERLGHGIGWPPERVDAQRGAREAWLAAVKGDEPPATVADCGAIRRVLAGWRQRAAGGETAAVRDWVQASGRRWDEFASVARLNRERDLVADAAAVSDGIGDEPAAAAGPVLPAAAAAASIPYSAAPRPGR